MLYLNIQGYTAQYTMVDITIPSSRATMAFNSIHGWILIHQNLDINFGSNRSWSFYRNGFGTSTGNYWAGLETMHQLTSNAAYRLRIEMQARANNLWYSAEYDSFTIASEAASYSIHASGYTGDAGDSIEFTDSSPAHVMNGMKFSTLDVDNDLWPRNCASVFGAGWWYNGCYYFLLTGNASTSEWDSLVDKVGLSTYKLLASRMLIKTSTS